MNPSKNLLALLPLLAAFATLQAQEIGRAHV